MNDDTRKGVEAALKLAKAEGVPLNELLKLLADTYQEASGSVDRSPRVGSLVDYWDPKKGSKLASVLEVHPGGLLKLRVHLTAQPNYDLSGIAFSAEPSPGRWSYRRPVQLQGTKP